MRFQQTAIALTATLSILASASTAWAGPHVGTGAQGLPGNINQNSYTQQQTPSQTVTQIQRTDPNQVPNQAADPAITAAEDALKKAKIKYDQITKDLMNKFQQTPDFVAAAGDLKKASDAYESAKNAVLDALVKRPDYQDALKTKDMAVSEMEQMRKDNASPDKLADGAAAIMAARTKVTAMQTTALTGDATATSAKSDLDAARDKIKDLQTQFEETLPQNADWAAAQQAVKDDWDKLETLAHNPEYQHDKPAGQ